MKVQLTYLFKFTIMTSFLMTTLLISSCGKKANTVNSSNLTGSSLFYNGNSAFQSNPQIITHVQNIKAGVQCTSGRQRLQQDVTFNVTGGARSGTTISGNFVEGVLPGNNSDLYVGVSLWRDLMFVTKVTNGSQVVGFNVTLSFCDVANPAGIQFPLLVSNERRLVNFIAPTGIVLDMNTYCGYGVIDSAQNTWITSQVAPSNQYTSPFTFPTSFTKPYCNGQF
jgi:hypothetical protein